MMDHRATNRGFTLLELVISMALGVMLVTGVTQLALAVGGSYRVQQNLGAIQENARFAFESIGREIEAAGYRPEPWQSVPESEALGDLGIEGVGSSHDRVSIRRWSDQNCFENPNTVLDENGLARMYLRESTFSINSTGSFSVSCRYGPGANGLVTQINNLGLVEHAESLQALYSEDSNDDGSGDRWVSAGQWSDESNIRAIRLGLLLASPDVLTQTASETEQVLGTHVSVPADGRLRRLFETTFVIRSRIR